VNGLLLSGATAAIGLVTACAPCSALPDRTVAVGTYRAAFSAPSFTRPKLERDHPPFQITPQRHGGYL